MAHPPVLQLLFTRSTFVGNIDNEAPRTPEGRPVTNTIPSAWKGERVVESFEIDKEGRLRPHILFSWLLAAAWGHTRGTAWSFDGVSAQTSHVGTEQAAAQHHAPAAMGGAGHRRNLGKKNRAVLRAAGLRDPLVCGRKACSGNNGVDDAG